MGVPSRGSWTPSYSCTGATRDRVGCGLGSTCKGRIYACTSNELTYDPNNRCSRSPLVAELVSRTSLLIRKRTICVVGCDVSLSRRGEAPSQQLFLQPSLFSLVLSRRPPTSAVPSSPSPGAAVLWRVILAKLAVSLSLATLDNRLRAPSSRAAIAFDTRSRPPLPSMTATVRDHSEVSPNETNPGRDCLSQALSLLLAVLNKL